jgi:hypothetical protein
MKGITVAIALTTLFILTLNARSEPFDANGNQTQIIAKGAPSGCPFRRFCGCALAQFLSLDNRDGRYNLAWNWQRLHPRTTARPGAAAVRHGHVMLLVAPTQKDGWFVVRDYNSGGGKSRIHVRSVRGFVFVDPSQRLTKEG